MGDKALFSYLIVTLQEKKGEEERRRGEEKRREEEKKRRGEEKVAACHHWRVGAKEVGSNICHFLFVKILKFFDL